MHKLLLFFLVLTGSVSYSQQFEGQNFCEATKDASYFPLAITKKKILWKNTFYFETQHATKTINGKNYIAFQQEWKEGNSDLLYLREENGIVYQYDDCCEVETIRYNPQFTIGHTWKTADQTREYKVIAYDGKLRTPFCDYQNLLVIEAKMDYGHYNFYYLKGHGYIGATQNGQLISCVTPKW